MARALGRLQRLLWTEGPTALPEAITQATWERFFNENEPVHAFVAEQDGRSSAWRTTFSTAAPPA